jgi:hypothetical protein
VAALTLGVYTHLTTHDQAVALDAPPDLTGQPQRSWRTAIGSMDTRWLIWIGQAGCAEWDRIKHHLPGQRGQHGGVARDDRRSLEAVLWFVAPAPRDDLPEWLCNSNSQLRRFERWAVGSRSWMSCATRIGVAGARLNERARRGSKKRGTALGGQAAQSLAGAGVASP